MVLWGLLVQTDHAPLMEMTVILLIKLLKKLEKQSSSVSLTLSWEPVYNHIRRVFFLPTCHKPIPAIYQHSHLWPKLIGLAKRYFASDSLDPIMRKVRPLLYPNHWRDMAEFQAYLVLFFPTRSSCLKQGHLEEIFKIWDYVSHSTTWDCQFMHLISKIVVHNPLVKTTRDLDFTPFLEKIFQTGLKLIDIPIGSDAINPRKTDYPGDLSFLAKKKVIIPIYLTGIKI